MGKGDKKSKRGKIIKGSYGVRRPRKKSSPVISKAKPAAKKAKAPQAEPKDAEVVKKATTAKTATKKKPESAAAKEKETTKKAPAKKAAVKEKVKKEKPKAEKTTKEIKEEK